MSTSTLLKTSTTGFFRDEYQQRGHSHIHALVQFSFHSVIDHVSKSVLAFRVLKYIETDWANHELNEEETLKFANGIVFTGQWKDNLCEKKGTMKYKNGVVYNWGWKRNKKRSDYKTK